jgi:hypothetical protein
MTTTQTPVHGRQCIDNALGSITQNNDDTRREYARGEYAGEQLANLLSDETDEVAVEWIQAGMVTCRCDEYVDGVNVAALGARLVPFLPAAIERFGSLESAVDHLVALMAADAADEL